jgi:nitrile hydratase accessory protein
MMGVAPDQRIGLMAGPAALPRLNGEIDFGAPWEGRAFGVAVALCDQSLYAWGDFRDGLVAEIAAGENAGVPSGYYKRWLAALENLVIARGLVRLVELDARTTDYLSGERDDDE